MNLYLVRHGESIGNAARFHQDHHTKLSETGIKQAKAVAKRFKKIPIDLIYCSPMTRAKQTADYINKIVQAKIIYTKLLKEGKRPTEVENKSIDDPEVQRIRALIAENYHNPEYRFSDEENFPDVKKRVLGFLDLVTKAKKENILAVTHGIMAANIISALLFGPDMTSYENEKLIKLLWTNNTGITLCRQDEETWRLITWNDQAHLD